MQTLRPCPRPTGSDFLAHQSLAPPEGSRTPSIRCLGQCDLKDGPFHPQAQAMEFGAGAKPGILSRCKARLQLRVSLFRAGGQAEGAQSLLGTRRRQESKQPRNAGELMPTPRGHNSRRDTLRAPH